MSATPRKYVLLPGALPPVVNTGQIDIQNIAAVILRNAGTATVNLWNGLYTLDSKETLSLNVTEEFAAIDLNNINVTFDTSTGGIQKLQIIVLQKKLC